jgi:hypothetical protein
MNVSAEVEEIVRRMMRCDDYPSENAVLLAALQALGERRQVEDRPDRKTLHPVSVLGTRLRQIRAEYVAGGGDLLTVEEFDGEMAQRRGERNPGD